MKTAEESTEEKTVQPIEVGKANATQIKAWKAKEGVVLNELTFFVEDTNELHYAYVSKPTFENMDMCVELGQGDRLKQGKLLLENCWLGGSDFVKTDDETRWTAYLEMHSLFSLRLASVKKL